MGISLRELIKETERGGKEIEGRREKGEGETTKEMEQEEVGDEKEEGV